MDPQPNQPDSSIFYGLAPNGADLAHLIWALHNYPTFDGLDNGQDNGAEAAPWKPGDQTDPSAYQVKAPPIADTGAAQVSPFGPGNVRADWPPSILDPIAAPNIRFYTAQPGDSISTILGTNDPAPIGAFMLLNGLTSSQIQAGKTYQLPDPNAPLRGSAAVGSAAESADRARLVALQASSGQRAAGLNLSADNEHGPPPTADFSVGAMLGLHPDPQPSGPTWKQLTSERYQLGQVLENLHRPGGQAFYVSGQPYESFHTANADGIRPPLPSLQNYNPEGDKRAAFLQTLGKLEDSPLGAVGYGGAKLMGADEPTAELALDIGSGLEGVGLAMAGLQPDGVDRDPQWSVGQPPILPTGFRPPQGGAYVLRDPETWQEIYAGRTKNFYSREGDYENDPVKGALVFDPLLRSDLYDEQRGLEQYLYDRFTPLLNRIRPISLSNENIDDYLAAAQNYLDREGEP